MSVFAWKNATYMARNRKASELPESWKTPTPLSDNPMHTPPPRRFSRMLRACLRHAWAKKEAEAIQREEWLL